MFESYPAELRPVLTRHRLRRRRHRSAATLLTGAALALGLAALRPAPASASATARAQSAARTDSPDHAAYPTAVRPGRASPAAVPRHAAPLASAAHTPSADRPP
jgi:hypothetical protein